MTAANSVPSRLRSKVHAALDWYGPARAIATAGSVVVVCIGAWWLLRAPAPPLENSLPFAATTSVGAIGPDAQVAATLSATTLLVPLDAADITVHVVGAVVAPGVYTLSSVGRVVDAVTAAGGPTPEADLSALNMALPLADADQVYVPSRTRTQSKREVPTTKPRRTNPTHSTVPQDIAAASSVVSDSTAPGVAGRVNINTADASSLESLPGVGPSTAKAIIAHRQANGPFSTPEGLLEVKGIGDAKFAAMRSLVVVS
jgi:competence protein ComEA